MRPVLCQCGTSTCSGTLSSALSPWDIATTHATPRGPATSALPAWPKHGRGCREARSSSWHIITTSEASENAFAAAASWCQQRLRCVVNRRLRL